MKKLAIAAAMFAGAAAAQAAPVVGSTFALVFSADPSFGVSDRTTPNFVVGAGVEVNNFGFDQVTLDVSANSLVLSWTGNYNSISYFNGAFNGFRLVDVFGQADDFTSVALGAASDVVGFDASRLSFTGDVLTLDLQNLSMTPGQQITVNFNTAATTSVPEPASLALVGLGLVGLASARRHKQA
ncbi:MAG: PEP-CTERM sorting domain-containing protein [Xylophilus ampelinus]